MIFQAKYFDEQLSLDRNKNLKTFSINWPSTWNYISTNEEIKIGTNFTKSYIKNSKLKLFNKESLCLKKLTKTKNTIYSHHYWKCPRCKTSGCVLWLKTQ